MANPTTLQIATKLYSPSEPEGRIFQAGEPWPGDAWSSKLGGDPVGANAAAGALKDLIDANDRLDQMGQTLASKDHDLAVLASERDAANDKVAGLEQDAIAAKRAQADAEELARAYMVERDSARAELEALKAKKAKAEPEAA